MTKHVAIFGRHSSDQQNALSTKDQIQLCKEAAHANGWEVTQVYSDEAISGSSLILLQGLQTLLQDARAGKFDMVLCEAMDRISRDQEDIAAIYKRLTFAEVEFRTLAEGKVTPLHIGLKGTMNAEFLTDLKKKTHRGLKAVAQSGKSAGGKAFGYDVLRRFDGNNELIRGEREINTDEARIVTQIFELYAYDNMSPKAIAAKLNADGVQGINGKNWGQSTINGNRRRASGILNNQLYIGKQVWNKLRYMKDPLTGKRVSRLNAESDWVVQDIPTLRIISDDLWLAVKARQKTLDGKILSQTNRPQYLLSGLMKCGECGGGYSKLNQTHYGCSTSHNKGTTVCSNRQTIRRDKLENFVLGALQTRLMRVDMVKIFCQEFEKHFDSLQSKDNDVKKQSLKELARLQKQKDNIVQAIKDGVPAEVLKGELVAISEKLDLLDKQKNTQPKKSKPVIHSGLALQYAQQIKELKHAFATSSVSSAIRERIRNLIDKIILTPFKEKDALKIDLYGKISGLFDLANEGIKSENSKPQKQLSPHIHEGLDCIGCGSRI